MFALVSALEPLRVANRFGGELYRWRLVGLQRGPIRASNQIEIYAEYSYQEVEGVEFLIICAGFNPKHYFSSSLQRWLNQLGETGCTLGAIDTGIYFLTQANLVGREKVTLHWEQIPSFQEEFPDIAIGNKIFETSARRFYCAGGAAGMDMMLQKIISDYGPGLAMSVSRQFLLSRIRTQEEHQTMQLSIRHNICSKRLAAAISLMENHIEEPLCIDDISSRSCVSRRQLERLFKTIIGETPSEFYLKLRLGHARSLLRETSLAIIEISAATGFGSVSYFSRVFRRLYGKTPTQDRK